MKPMYERRLLLFTDILGWSNAVFSAEKMSALVTVMEKIHQHAIDHNERERAQLREADGKIIDTPLGRRKMVLNHAYLQIQFGAFSDHHIYSTPAKSGARIVGAAQRSFAELLCLGHLSRGAVVVGELYHRDNIVFGPALIEAVRLEESEAFYPRIIISDEAFELIKADGVLSDCRYMPVIEDQTGRMVVNPFAVPFDGLDDGSFESFLELNFHFSKLRRVIFTQIDELRGIKQHKAAEKWTFLQRFIEGPVFEATPKLSKFWVRD